MPSKKKSSKGGKGERSPKGSVGMSLETATLLLAQSYLSESDVTATFKGYLDSPLPPDEKDALKARYKEAIEKAATLVSFHAIVEGTRRNRTAEGLAYSQFILRKMRDGKQDDNSRRTTDELMRKVWDRIKGTKLVQDAIKHSAINSELLTPQIIDRFYKRLRRKAPGKWRAFVSRLPLVKQIKEKLISTLNDEMNL